ncbi:MAG: ATP-binding cassette domain-containing protein [Candidatus Thiodiazotropha sp.]
MIAIQAQQLSKNYRQYAKPADLFKEWLLKRPFHSEIKALTPIDLMIEKGATFGVIGDNGAGKSTLLKLLAGTLQPSSGSLRIEGRKSAILELGSGFHPEFSGLENIRLACSMLGLGAAETNARIPDIIAFSELGDAIMRPVKSYSSGMFVCEACLFGGDLDRTRCTDCGRGPVGRRCTVPEEEHGPNDGVSRRKAHFGILFAQSLSGERVVRTGDLAGSWRDYGPGRFRHGSG